MRTGGEFVQPDHLATAIDEAEQAMTGLLPALAAHRGNLLEAVATDIGPVMTASQLATVIATVADPLRQLSGSLRPAQA
jgi:hypothetical protein